MKFYIPLIGCYFGLVACQGSEPITLGTITDERITEYQRLVAEIEQACDFTGTDECQITLNEQQKARLEGVEATKLHFISTGNENEGSSLERRSCMGIAFSYDDTCTNTYKEAELCYQGQAWESHFRQSVRIRNLSQEGHVITISHGESSEQWNVQKRWIPCFKLREGDSLQWL